MSDLDLVGKINLAQRNLGAEVLSASDDFFADKENLLNPVPPVFIDGKFTERGKWMDGWESRRRRTPGHDNCVMRICRGKIVAIDIDTTHFTGNFPEHAMVEACDSDSDPDTSTEWTEILPLSTLKGDTNNLFAIDSDRFWNHLRLNIYPDGGVARLRVYGTVHKNWQQQTADEMVDLAALLNGGVALACSDMHFGNMWNLLSPGRAVNMGDGWETARRRGPGHDWVIVQLGQPGQVHSIEIDTLHFKGNYPARCTVQAAYAPGASLKALTHAEFRWTALLENVSLSADAGHHFEQEVKDIGVISHVMLEIFPDGGVGRFRVYGKPTATTSIQLQPIPLTAETFKPYGDVIEKTGHSSRRINEGYADRYEQLTQLDLTEGGHPALSLFHARPIPIPFPVTRMERHPRSSQLFMPKGSGKFLVLVADDADELDPEKLQLFISNGDQGVNYRRGVWHHFLMAVGQEQDFIVVDRSEPDENTDEVELPAPYPIITAFE